MNILIKSINFSYTEISMDRVISGPIIVNYKIVDYHNKIEGEYKLSSKETILDLDKIKDLIITDLKSVVNEYK